MEGVGVPESLLEEEFLINQEYPLWILCGHCRHLSWDTQNRNMASLQTSLLAAFILLAMALQATEAGPYGANVEDSICCRDYIRFPLPLRVVKYYYWTSQSCRRPGVVFVTGKGREICADPSLFWVKKFVQKMN